MTSIIYRGGGYGPALGIIKNQRTWTGVLNPGPLSLDLNVPTLGPADPGRRIFVAAAGVITGGITGLTIGGVTGQILVPSAVMFMGTAPLATGTSTTINFQFATNAVKNFTAFVFSVYNLKTTVPIDNQAFSQNSSAATLNGTLNLLKGGLLIGCGTCAASTAAITSSSVTNLEDEWNGSNHQFGFWEETGATETPRALTFTKSGAGSGVFQCRMLSFR